MKIDIENINILDKDLWGGQFTPSTEVYKVIKDFPRYEISRQGNIRQVGNEFSLHLRFLKYAPYFSRDRIIYTTSLFKDKVRHKVIVNDLLMEAFGTNVITPYYQSQQGDGY